MFFGWRAAMMDRTQTPKPATTAHCWEGHHAWIYASTISVFAVLCYLFRNAVIDDAYIYLRYAENLRNYYEPLWNVNGAREYGNTEVVWTVWLSLHPVLWFAKASGVVFTLAGCLILSWAARCWLPMLLLCWPSVALMAMLGMGTPLTWLFVCVLVVALHKRWLSLTVALVVLSPFVRSELFVFAAVATVLYERKLWPVVALTPLAWLSFNVFYMGQLLPNAFYVKAVSGPNMEGLAYVAGGLALFVPLIVPALCSAHRKLALAALIQCLYFVTVLPLMGTESRFLMPMLPVFAFCAASTSRAYLPRRATGLWIAAFLLFPFCRFRECYLHSTRLYDSYIVPVTELAKSLKGLDRIATGDCGIIPYYSQANILDLIGLNDKAIALGADPMRRIIEFDPQVVILYAEDNLSERPEFSERYEHRMTLSFGGDYWVLTYVVFTKKKTP